MLSHVIAVHGSIVLVVDLTCSVCVLNFFRFDVSGRRIIWPLQWGFVIEVEANLISTPVSDDVITCFFCGVPVLQPDFSVRRILAVRIWHDLLLFIVCVVRSREEHLLWFWPILWLVWVAVGLIRQFCSWGGSLSAMVLNWLGNLFVGCSVTVIRDCSWLTCGLLQNPLLLISFQHEGDCEAWTAVVHVFHYELFN